ncbi:MAG: glycosyltransferase family 4 protein [Acetobacteraceae bacterium]|nr:glycosyltransferase family 4 protein [Acetobacteraceae bacterium]
MVVLQVLPALATGGVERGTVEIAEAVAGRGGTALVASAGGRLVRSVERAGGQHVTVPLATKNPLAMLLNARRLAGLIRDWRVEIVHARSRAPAWSAWIAARRTGAHFVTTYHGAYGERVPLKRHYNSVMAKGERVIAISRYIARLVEERHGVDPARLRIIPRGVDPSAFDPENVSPERIARLVELWRLPVGVPVVLLPARLSRWKGQRVLLESMVRLTTQDVCCVLLGPTRGRERYVAELQRSAARLGLADRVRIPGPCEDMPAALMVADAVVHASIEPEAFGRVVIEAQAMGRPVIAADLGGPAETVEDGLTGWRVPPGDASALAARLDLALALAPEQRAALALRSRAAVLARYTTRAMQEETLAVYGELLA